jgi:DNA-binding NtrC family response regulator
MDEPDETGELPPVRRSPRELRLCLDERRSVRLRGKQRLLVGSGSRCRVRLTEPTVSRKHAELRPGPGGWVLHDLGSRNGTFLDGIRVERAWLSRAATLRFGAATVRVLEINDGEDRRGQAGVVGGDPAFLTAMDSLRRLARFRHPVAIRGETGTGKDVAARLLHEWSPRASGPFIAVNCASIAATLAESELFGHERGAFTGAEKRHIGAFERADGGTLFLDELGELPLALQAKLLRVLETGTIRRVGGERPLSVDVRIVSATHRDLESMVSQARLREDLYHRLGVLTVRLPPLRERPSDIPALLEHFAREIEDELGIRVRLTEAAVRAAVDHQWPGNIRALRNAVTRAAALANGPISARALFAGASAHEPAIAIPRGTYSQMSRALVERVVAEEGSLRRAAATLDVPRSTLHDWIRRAAIERPRGDGALDDA